MIRGIWAAALTPITGDFLPDADKAVPYYRALLDAGCDGINLLGTTGEAMSFGADARLRFMEAVAGGGLPLARIMAGTGAASIADAVRLTAGALDLGFAAALVMPPFFFRDAGDDGILRFYDALLARIPRPDGRIVLYNFPAMSGITFSPRLVDRLAESYGSAIAGLKDSSNDRALQREILARRSDFAVLPGSEAYLSEALAYGCTGCISGSVALWPSLAQTVFRYALAGEPDFAGAASSATDDALLLESRRLAERRSVLDGMPFIPAVRYCVAQLTGDDSWERAMPPLVPLSRDERTILDRRLASLSS